MKPTYEELLEENTKLRALVRKLMDRVAHLESQLKQNSKNSSKPPSSDRKSNLTPKKKREGRPFHPGASRQLLPESAVTSREVRTVDLLRGNSIFRSTSIVLPTYCGIFEGWQNTLPRPWRKRRCWESYTRRLRSCSMISIVLTGARSAFLLGGSMDMPIGTT